MSLINGDKARSGRARKKKIQQRMRDRALRAALQAKKAPAAGAAKTAH